MNYVLTGLDRVARGEFPLPGDRIGLLCNQASLDRELRHASKVISAKAPGRLRVLFGPQHGFTGHEQDNMIETSHRFDKELSVNVFSLYSDTREPQPHMLEELDTLLIDLQDVGTRVYTFASTVLGCLKASASYGKRVVILDRPNPLGGEVMEGNCLSEDLISFVGPWRMPMRHGLTMGELARLFNEELSIGCDLEIIPMSGWRRDMLWPETGARWLMPSPNMPIFETALVYPGQVLWEGTNVSEGRGTCRPFEIFGAPFFDCPRLLNEISRKGIEGCIFQPYVFKPTFNKWSGKVCHGLMIHVVDPRLFKPYLTGISLLQAVSRLHRDDFRLKDPPYEYEYEKRPLDLILGQTNLFDRLLEGVDLRDLEEEWNSDIAWFKEARRCYLLY